MKLHDLIENVQDLLESAHRDAEISVGDLVNIIDPGEVCINAEDSVRRYIEGLEDEYGNSDVDALVIKVRRDLESLVEDAEISHEWFPWGGGTPTIRDYTDNAEVYDEMMNGKLGQYETISDAVAQGLPACVKEANEKYFKAFKDNFPAV
ncbi:hypothetical protein [Corynebacterium mastitidis]|uniref:hypothetical protein n=1 Tax=Corynebacterium mastitidis TaxID=161890 RepID=UPI00036A27A6|nr:hypothetical protein [Corynebacterium mastitidis]